MRQITRALLFSSALTLAGCGQAGQQWMDPDKTFALFDQPKVKSVNDTQEEMAKEAAANGDYARAGQFYQQLVSSQKGTPEQVLRYKLGWADAMRRTGNTDTALAMFEELHQQNPANVDIAEGRGLTLVAAGKATDAGRALSEVLEKDPKRWRTLNALGILFVTKNMIPEAMAYYAEALANSPDNAAILNNVGLSQAADRNFPRAIEALQQASRVSKSPAQRKQIELNLAMVHGVSGDLDTAREVAGKYLEGPALDNNLGLYAHLAKDDALARSYLNMALSQSPTFYERAWDNLDVINDNAHGGGKSDAPAVAAPRKLPKLDALSAPDVKREKPKKGKAKESKENKPEEAEPEVVDEPKLPAATLENKASAPAVEVEPAIPVEPAAKPAPTAAKPVPKPTEKPAGLVVGPSEGD